MNKGIFNLEKKHIIITGAAGLLGQEHAQAIADFGGIPILIDLDYSKLKKLSDNILESTKIKSYFFVCDITDESELMTVCKKIKNLEIDLYGLINNAARNPKIENDNFSSNRLEDLNIEEFQKDLSVGLLGATLCAKYFGKIISENTNGGVIINISSDLGLIAPDQRLYRINSNKNNQPVKPVSYSIVKSGIIGLTKYLSTYWCGSNVRCNAICPGGVENNQPEDFLKKIENLIPLGRMAKKEEYKATIIWMLSEHNEYLNGAVVSVDGGRTAW